MGSNKTIIELQKRTEELSAALRAETGAHGRDLAELEGLRGRAAVEEQRIARIQEALEQKQLDLAKQDERFRERAYATALKLKGIRREQKLRLEAEAESARAALKREIEEERRRAHDELFAKVQSFSDNYGYYLSQLKLMMDLLTKAAMNTGKVFLTSDSADTEKMFRSEMSKGSGRVVEPEDTAHEADPGESGRSDETTEG